MKSMVFQGSLFDPQLLTYGPDLSSEQAKVRDHGAGNQVVVAGAGTGKTETLTQRILKLLVEGDGQSGPVELSNVLALTFTDKGAAEMRGRVYARLVEILRGLERGEERTRLENLRAGWGENNRILTFDAFSFRLLGQFPEHSPFGGEVTILDSAAKAQRSRDVTRQFWNRVETTFSAAQKQELWELLELFPSRGAALGAMRELAETESEDDLRVLAALPDEEAWRADFEAQMAREGARLWQRIETELEKLDVPPAMKRELLDAELVLHGGRSCPITKTGWGAAWSRTHSPELIHGLERVGRYLREWKAEVQTERDAALDWKSRVAVARLGTHALWWSGANREYNAQNGVADFFDIAAAAARLVENREVAASLRANFSHILIDEFQDTNWRQWRLIDALRDAMRGNVLIVGDEKQAIFRFRGGDITVFDAVRRTLLGREKADELTVSRRSTRPLVEWTNAVFRNVLPSEQKRQSFEAPFQDLHSPNDAKEASLWRIEPHIWHFDEENALWQEKQSQAIQNERAGRALARFLRQLCDDGTLWKQSDNPALRFPDLHRISQRIARGERAVGVIFTSHAVKTVFESQLRAFDVPFVSVKGTGFWGSEPAAWTWHLLRLLLDGSDQTAFIGLARSPLGALSDVALLEWRLALEADTERGDGEFCAQIDGFSPSRLDDARAWPVLVERLRAWRDMARVWPVSDVLELVLEQSELAFYEAGLPDEAQREQNWRKIVDLLREREAAGEGGLRALIDNFSGLMSGADGDKEADAPLPTQGSIVLLTTHAAKGLGFPMTILAQLDAAPGAPKSTNLLRGNLDGARQMAFRLGSDEEDEKNVPKPHLWERLRAQDAAEEEAQWRRLFYVACTRAESQLVLVAPEREVRSEAAWVNLCGRHIEKTEALRPVGALPREKSAAPETGIEKPLSVPPPLPRTASEEIALRDIAGPSAEKFVGKARGWMENRLGELGQPSENIREDVPFSAPAFALGFDHEGWVVGTWEWLAPLADGKMLLCATGQSSEVATERVKLMALAARDAGFELLEAWAIWPHGDEIGSRQMV